MLLLVLLVSEESGGEDLEGWGFGDEDEDAVKVIELELELFEPAISSILRVPSWVIWFGDGDGSDLM